MKLTIHKEQKGTFLRSEDGGLVASLEAGYQSMRDVHADIICQSCNAHDDLVSALGACQMALLGYTHQNDITQKALVLAQSALSKSKDTK